ncbi:LytR C-terminal domain-containing protein [Bifidobacterium magnum]|uniref:LytR cell envelope-related transcriptional attenuator n=1 Tax=Bifidobacterium magnum TaxID=1692 RepID=A0A087BCQ7_9BIFI|nr:LytR C-terminal domain-containing protein [Bifidobacterium magnum]KFI68807.1 LytR cell envelope-related transcriptional attenuator [Bifidobacterium magnum]
MAHSGNDKNTYDSYPKDAYDTPPAGPVGVHRGARSLGARSLPFIIVIVAAVIAGLLFWSIFSGQAARVFSGDSQTQAASEQTTSQTASETASSTPSHEATHSESADASQPAEDDQSATTDQPQDEESATPEQTGSVDYSAQVSVINGTGVQGYAAQESQKLAASGFTAATPGNPDEASSLPGTTVVWYQSPEDEATAQAVAQSLGIDAVAQANIDVPVMVVLMQ